MLSFADVSMWVLPDGTEVPAEEQKHISAARKWLEENHLEESDKDPCTLLLRMGAIRAYRARNAVGLQWNSEATSLKKAQEVALQLAQQNTKFVVADVGNVAKHSVAIPLEEFLSAKNYNDLSDYWVT